ncbi:MAG: outer membrane lipoprotein carrier protein LolA [Candidatus Binataceae bacterium]
MIRSFIAAVAITLLASICVAGIVVGPALVPGQMMQGRFVQRRQLKGLTATLKSDGNFILVPGRGLIWRVVDPIKTTTVITPAGIRQIINGNEVQNIDAARAPFVAHFYAMMSGALMGHWETMRHDFAIKTTGDSAAWRTVLTPLRPDDPIAGMIASIVITGGKMVDDVDITRANGDSESIAFLDQVVSSAALSGEDARLLRAKGLSPTD